MKILLTGATSFTGFHFAQALADKGFDVAAAVRSPVLTQSNKMRDRRLVLLDQSVKVMMGGDFGSEFFLKVLRETAPDILCHHAALVGDYRNPDYDLLSSVAANTNNLRKVLAYLPDHGAFIATGSIFENDEGAGNPPLRAFSPYGLSKALSWQVEKYHCQERGIAFGKFVIPNPFGPFEEPRFCHYLINCWKEAKVAQVRTPSYVRDNIHVSLLAEIYADFVKTVVMKDEKDAHCNPCGYIETQGAFTERFAQEMRCRSALTCDVKLLTQQDFSEPLMRINTDFIRPRHWNEEAAWNSVAEFYDL